MDSSDHTPAAAAPAAAATVPSSTLNGGDSHNDAAVTTTTAATTSSTDASTVDSASSSSSSTSSSTTAAAAGVVDDGVPLVVTRIATIGYTVGTGEWIDEEKLARPLKDAPTDISICIDARKEKVKNDFLQKQDQLSDDDKQFIRDTKERKKRQGKKALWALTWCDEQKRKTLPELWQKAKESNITHDLSQVKLVVRRNVLNSLANMLYTKESDQKHGHKYEHPQEYCVEKRDGTLFLDVIRSNYELREWRFGRDILGKAMENAFIANTDIELYNTLIIQGKGDIQVGITADFGYTDIDGSPCELSPISSDRVNDEKRILNSWIRAKLGGIAKITKVVYDRAPGKPITITEIVTDVAEVADAPPAFPGFDALFDTLAALVVLADTLPDGAYYTTYRSGTGFTELTSERREDTRRSRFLNHPPRGGFYGGGRGGFHHHHRQGEHPGSRGGRQPIHHHHHHAQLFYQPPLNPEPSIYVRNLPFDTTREELTEFFTMNNCKVKDLFIHFDPPTGRPKGSAIVDFYDFESFSLALGLSGQQVKGRSIEVKIARKFPPMHAQIPTPDPRGDRPEDLWDRGKRPDQRGAIGPAGVGAHPPPGAGAIPAPYHAGYPPAAYRVGPPRAYPPHGFAPGIVPMGYYPAPHERSYRGGRGRGGNWVPNQRGGHRAPHHHHHQQQQQQQQQQHHMHHHHHGAHQQLQQVLPQPELLPPQQILAQQVPEQQL